MMHGSPEVFQAQENFSKARKKARLYNLMYILNPDRKRLISLNEMAQLIKHKNQVYAGVKAVPVRNIIGSEGRYNDFDTHFLPRSNELKQRWIQIDTARLCDVVLPPVQLYEIAGLYFVRDGNHRVSVAKTQGVEFIDAEVISLQSSIMLPPHVHRDTLAKEVIQYEKRLFYAKTGFGDMTDYWELDFTRTGKYKLIYEHILGHKYFLNEKQHSEIAFQTALNSWFETVYQPILNTIEDYTLMDTFKNRTKSDLYVWLVNHWDALKQIYGNTYSLEAATQDFIQSKAPTKPSFVSKIKNYMQALGFVSPR